MEHADAFAWTGEAADYPLIIAGGAAHGGFVGLPKPTAAHWLPYIAVADADHSAERAAALGAEIARPAFDVPGVGRSAVIRDPQGAAFCLFTKAHGFPVPAGAFLSNVLLTDDLSASAEFYTHLFGWKANSAAGPEHRQHTFFQHAQGAVVAGAQQTPSVFEGEPAWIPLLAVQNLTASTEKATALGARVLGPLDTIHQEASASLMLDPQDAPVTLMQPGDH